MRAGDRGFFGVGSSSLLSCLERFLNSWMLVSTSRSRHTKVSEEEGDEYEEVVEEEEEKEEEIFYKHGMQTCECC